MIRLFVALELDRQIKEKLESFASSFNIAGARIISANNLHITVKFLGYTEPNLLPAINKTLKEIASRHQKFDIVLDHLGAFPSKRKSRIFWMGSKENTSVVSLVDDLDKALETYGYKIEKRSFKIHLTLARFKPLADLSKIIEQNIDTIRQEIDHLSLFESKLSPKGAQYKALEKFFLKNA